MSENAPKQPDEQTPQQKKRKRPIKEDVAIAAGIAASLIAAGQVVDAMNRPKPAAQPSQPADNIKPSQTPAHMSPSFETTSPTGTKVTVNFSSQEETTPTQSSPESIPVPTQKPTLAPSPEPTGSLIPPVSRTPEPTPVHTPEPTGSLIPPVSRTPEPTPILSPEPSK